MSSPKPGWYDDPVQPGQLRWWDGNAWTHQTRDLPPAPPLPPNAFGDGSGLPASPSYTGPDGSWSFPPPPATPAQGSSRGRVALVGAISVAVLGAAIAFAQFAPNEGDVFDLERGDCFDLSEASGEDDQVSTVPIVACGVPHESEVFALFDLEGTQFPGVQTTADLATYGCLDRFEDEVGGPLDLTDLTVTTLRPTQESWSRGDREVACILESGLGESLTGSRLGSIATWSLGVGECFDAPVFDETSLLFGGPYRSLPCDLEHVGEVYHRFEVPSGPHPGAEQLLEVGDGTCHDAFEPAIGQAWEASPLEYRVIVPSLGRWEVGGRVVHCYVFDPSGPMVGTAANWVLLHTPPDAGALPAYDLTRLDVGDCFNDPFDEDFEGPVLPLACDGPHHNEAYLVFDLPGGVFPADLDAIVTARCDTPFYDYVGDNRIDLLWFYLAPDEFSWEQGDRRVVCAAYAEDLSDLTSSVRAGAI